jgi:hypothetical protein
MIRYTHILANTQLIVYFRLPDGRFIARSERMERKALQLYQQR